MAPFVPQEKRLEKLVSGNTNYLPDWKLNVDTIFSHTAIKIMNFLGEQRSKLNIVST